MKIEGCRDVETLEVKTCSVDDVPIVLVFKTPDGTKYGRGLTTAEVVQLRDLFTKVTT